METSEARGPTRRVEALAGGTLTATRPASAPPAAETAAGKAPSLPSQAARAHPLVKAGRPMPRTKGEPRQRIAELPERETPAEEFRSAPPAPDARRPIPRLPLRGGAPQHPTAAEIDCGPAKQPLVALTFDAGSSPTPTPAILQALADADLRCTFFLTGEWTAHNPKLVRRIAAAGHELGNHTYSHPDLRRLGASAVARELERTDALVREVAGRGTRPYFRPPFGARDRRVLREAARCGYRCVYWTTDSLDSVRAGITPRQIERRVLTRVHPGSIILMHCGSAATAQALPHLLAALQQKGYRVVTVGELMRAG